MKKGKIPKIFLNGKRIKCRPECDRCHAIREEPKDSDGWKFIDNNLIYGMKPYWLCPQCVRAHKVIGQQS